MHKNYLLIFVALLALFAASKSAKLAGNQRILEDEVTEVLECVRGVLKTGIEEVGLPSFEPLEVEHLVVNVTEFNINNAVGHVTLNTASISGITDWDLSDLKIDVNIIGGIGGSLVANIDLPKFVINTGYIADLSVSGINIFGEGEIYMELRHLGIAADAKILLNRITLSKLRLLPTLGDINFKITGLLNDEEHSELASQIVNDIAVDWINQKSEDFADLIEQFLQELVNDSQGVKQRDIGDIINAILDRCPLSIK